ncbi:MAG TPA: cytochrome bc complex cytochrome b subunit [Acidimicrobiales bacterium]|nr:cytochrome bc complex cytochrome b subunit [Acidimicrobiales bacterium]
MKPVRRLNAELDERLGTQSFLTSAFDHIFPDNWSFMLGEVAFYCFILLVVTGVYLTMFFDPSDTQVVYHGTYGPLRGQSMSMAYESTVRLSLDVKAGLLFRQVHHWAADLFLAAICLHLMRIFFSGAFRKPRDINWMVGVTLLLVSLFVGFTGYSLPDDLLSGLGLRIAYSIAESVPVIGGWLTSLFFGGQFPSDQLTHRLFIAHVLLGPGIIAALLAVHLSVLWRQKHTQFPGPGRSDKRLVGSQLWPTYAARSLSLLCAVAGTVALLGGLAQINPIWLYGPYTPESASAAAQPDWYILWLEGSLRLLPGLRVHLWGYEISEVFWAAVFIPLACFALMYAYPALERWWTGDRFSHNVLDRPRDRPGRTALGVAAVTAALVLTVAGAQDVLAEYLQVSQPPVTYALRGLVILLPALTGVTAWKICRDLRAPKPVEMGEEPQGKSAEAKPSPWRYLPDRARWEPGPEAEQPAARTGLRGWVAAAAGATGGLVVGLAAGRRRRPPPPDPDAGTVVDERVPEERSP